MRARARAAAAATRDAGLLAEGGGWPVDAAPTSSLWASAMAAAAASSAPTAGAPPAFAERVGLPGGPFEPPVVSYFRVFFLRGLRGARERALLFSTSPPLFFNRTPLSLSLSLFPSLETGSRLRPRDGLRGRGAGQKDRHRQRRRRRRRRRGLLLGPPPPGTARLRGEKCILFLGPGCHRRRGRRDPPPAAQEGLRRGLEGGELVGGRGGRRGRSESRAREREQRALRRRRRAAAAAAGRHRRRNGSAKARRRSFFFSRSLGSCRYLGPGGALCGGGAGGGGQGRGRSAAAAALVPGAGAGALLLLLFSAASLAVRPPDAPFPWCPPRSAAARRGGQGLPRRGLEPGRSALWRGAWLRRRRRRRGSGGGGGPRRRPARGRAGCRRVVPRLEGRRRGDARRERGGSPAREVPRAPEAPRRRPPPRGDAGAALGRGAAGGASEGGRCRRRRRREGRARRRRGERGGGLASLPLLVVRLRRCSRVRPRRGEPGLGRRGRGLLSVVFGADAAGRKRRRRRRRRERRGRGERRCGAGGAPRQAGEGIGRSHCLLPIPS